MHPLLPYGESAAHVYQNGAVQNGNGRAHSSRLFAVMSQSFDVATSDLGKRWRVLSGEKKPDPSRKSNAGIGVQTRWNHPGNIELIQMVQQMGLTKIFNEGHPHHPIPPKEFDTGTRNRGVDYSPKYIDNLFESSEAFVERTHNFCLPLLSHGEAAFTDQELRQVLRELAIGEYVHNTHPFFSLHATKTGDLCSVIPPVYQNTLVGRILSMIDYLIKGYLSGGTYKAQFVDTWFQDPSWDRHSESALQQLINFGDHCKRELEGADKQYLSITNCYEVIRREVLKGGDSVQQTLDDDWEILRKAGFISSFWVRPRQKSIQKESNLFVLDFDFEVKTELKFTPEYQETLNESLRKTGALPASHWALMETYRRMEIKIQSHLVKLPLCRDYFSMLGVIHFFSGYFSTLRAHRIIPFLPLMETSPVQGVPRLFPALPVDAKRVECPQINPHKGYTRAFSTHRQQFVDYFCRFYREMMDSPTTTWENYQKKDVGRDPLLKVLQACFWESVLKLSTPTLRSFLRSQKDQLDHPIIQTVNDQMMHIASAWFNEIGRRFGESVFPLRSDPQIIRPEIATPPIIEQILDGLAAKQHDLKKGWTISYSIPRVPHDVSAKEIDRGRKIMGGCGMVMQRQEIQPSPKGKEILNSYRDVITGLPLETLTKVSNQSGELMGAVFCLQLEDIPAWVSSDHEWMETWLLAPPGTDIKSINAFFKLKSAMKMGDRERFQKAIDKTPNCMTLRDREGRSLLHFSVQLDDTYYTKTLRNIAKKTNFSVDVPDNFGYYPLHYAAMAGQDEQLGLLLKWGGQLNPLSHSGATPLMSAIQHKQRKAFQELCEKGAQAPPLSTGYTALHYALHSRDREIIDKVLNTHALLGNINHPDIEGTTPLMLACELGMEEVAPIILKKGGDSSLRRLDGMTAMEIAIMRDCLPVIRLIPPTPQDFETVVRDGSLEALEQMAIGPLIYTHTNSYGDTILHMTIRFGNIPAAKFLIEKNSATDFLNAKNQGGETPFSLAAAAGLWEVVKTLYRFGATVDFTALLKGGYNAFIKQIYNEQQLTPFEIQQHLLIAAQAGNYEAISEVLIPKGADLLALRGPNGWTIFHYLARCMGSSLFWRLISSERVDLLQPLEQEGGKTLPYIAALAGSPVLDLLLSQMQVNKTSLERHFYDRHLFYAIVESGNFRSVSNALLYFPESHLENQVLDEQGTYAVHLAAKMNSKAILELLHKNGASLGVKDKQGLTPRDYAARSGANDTIAYLNQQAKTPPPSSGINLTTGNDARQTPLHVAAQDADTETLKKLLTELKPTVQRAMNALGRTAIFYAILGRKKDNIRLLAQHGADLGHYDHQMMTPMLLACALQDPSIVRLLIELGADPNQVGTIDEMTPLHFSISLPQDEIARCLIFTGGKCDKLDRRGRNPVSLAAQENKIHLLHLFAAKKIPFDMTDSMGRRPIHVATFNGHRETVAALLDNNEGVDAPLDLPRDSPDNQLQKYDGATSLHLAAESGDAPMVRLLLDHRANANASTRNMDLLAFAATSRAPLPIFDLISASPIAQNRTAICRALAIGIKQDQIDVVKHFYRSAVLITSEVVDGLTSLELACRDGALLCTHWLLRNGAHLAGGYEKGLDLSAANSSAAQFALLLDFLEPNLDRRNQNGDTLLHIAARRGNYKHVMILLNRGAKTDITNYLELSPIQLARRDNHTEIVALLLTHERAMEEVY